jgi:uncharacterized protein (DUF2336 family)
MSASSRIIPELQELAKHGNARRRGEVVGQVAALFMAGAARFTETHIEVFDQVLQGLVAETEVKVRADLSERLCGLANAPRGIVGQLARDTEIKVAAPVLRQSPLLDEQTLIEIARSRGQDHLLAMAARPELSEPITDIIVRRGSREVVRLVAGNDGARFSASGYGSLIKRANDDGMLAIAVGKRPELSAPHLQGLISGAVDLVRRRIFAHATPERRETIAGMIGEASGAPKQRAAPRNFVAAQQLVLELHLGGLLGESVLAGFARDRKYEETVAALSAMAAVPLVVVDRLLSAEKVDPVYILCRAIDLQWATLRAVMLLRLGPGRAPSLPDLALAQATYEQIGIATAQRVVHFWQTRK